MISNGAEKSDDDLKNGILYELLVYAEWPQEPELFLGKEFVHNGETNFRKWLPTITGVNWWPFRKISCIPFELCQFKWNGGYFSWQFAVGGESKVIAILQEQTLEIRSYKDDYSTIVGKASLGKDAYPNWRKLTWSPDCTLLALSYSNGTVDFFDPLGFKLFSIESESLSQNDLSDALAAILFIEPRVKKTSWSFEVLLVNFKGHLKSYFVSSTEGYKAMHRFSFTDHYHYGITAVVYHYDQKVLICCGRNDAANLKDEVTAAHFGITAWHLISDAPYYRLSFNYKEEICKKNMASNIWHQLQSILFRRMRPELILKLCMSPNGYFLSALHASGTISLWKLPSLDLYKIFELEQQPNFNAENPGFTDLSNTRKKYFAGLDSLKNNIADINWWSDKALIVARCSGAITVSSINKFENLLGNSAEWFDCYPRLSEAYNRGFFVVECYKQFSSIRRSVTHKVSVDGNGEDSDNGSSYDSDSELSVVQKSSRIAKTLLCYITDSDRFQPPRKKLKYVTKTFRLICLKATTPDSLFARKLESGEYGEALSLAQMYDLDCDLVYQRQWRNCPVSVATIEDYLSKITKRSWVLHECISREPKSLIATMALLEYGLRGTDLETLISVGQGTDEGKFIWCDPQRVYMDNLVDEYDLEAMEKLENQEKEMRNSLLAQIDFSKMTFEQRQLCQIRQKLLQYLKRLNTYAVMLGRHAVASEHFDSKFFHRFRALPAVEATVEFAHLGDWQAVAAMFTFHGSETLPHRLAILSNFPETMSPFEYRCLLPEVDCGSSEAAVYPWEEETTSEKDWVLEEYCRHCLKQFIAGDGAEILYECNPELETFCGLNLTVDDLTQWYAKRAIEIEEQSKMVDNALELVRLGMDRNVMGLNELHDELVTFEVIVYECLIGDSFTLDCLRSMADIDKLQLLISRSTEENFIKHFRQWVLPFLARCDRRIAGSVKKLLKDYLISSARHNLPLCAKIFNNSRVEQPDAIISQVKELISLALDCIYACEENDQLDAACSILECLPVRGYGVETEALHDQLDLLERHLSAAEILQKHGVAKTVLYIRECQNKVKEVTQLLTQLTRVVSRRIPDASETNWRELLKDVMELQREVFHCIDSKTCLQIFVRSMLCSGKKENIEFAGELLQGAKKSHDSKGHYFKGILPSSFKVPVKSAISLIIYAAKEYFNSAADYNDSVMDLARHCLCMIVEPDDDIQAELDLIATLSILNEFGLIILPLQVRVCEDRLQLIKQIFSLKPTAYKSSQKLMKLAHLMRVGQDVKLWEGEIQILVATAAFKANDYSACYHACHYLGLKKYAKGWAICFDLGKCCDFGDNKARLELLAFAAMYCDSIHLEEIISNIHLLERKILTSRLQNEFGFITCPFSGNTKLRFLTGIFFLFKKDICDAQDEIPSPRWNTITKKTTEVLGNVSNIGFWKKNINWHVWNVDSQSNTLPSEEVGLEKLLVPAFYGTLMLDSADCTDCLNFIGYERPDEGNSSLNVGLILLRLALISDEKNSEEVETVLPFVLQQLATDLLPRDSLLALAHLLSLNDPTLTDECFQKFPITNVCLKLAILCYSLHICQTANLIAYDKLINSDAQEVIRSAVCYAKLKKKAAITEKLRKFCVLLLEYKRKLSDFVQAKQLHDLHRGVDVNRFSQDDMYKRETILGLAMSIDENVYKTAISLAHRYNIELWDVYMAHLTYLFSEEFDISYVESHIKALRLVDVLLEKKLQFLECLKNTISECISGTDHVRYLYYLTLLKQCSPKDNHLSSILSLLKRLQTIVPGIDFKKLLNERHTLTDVLSPVVCGTNIQAVVKILPTIAKVSKKSLAPSELYGAWLKKVFFFGDDAAEEKVPRSHQEWLVRYGSCKEHFCQLQVHNLIDFVSETLFVERVLNDIPESTRRQLLSRTMTYAMQERDKCSLADLKRQQWQDAVDYFNECLQHVDRMRSELVEEFRNSGDQVVHCFLRKLETSRPHALKTILLQCVTEGHSVETLQQLISICPLDLTPGDLILEALSVALNDIGRPGSDFSTSRDTIEVLRGIVDAILKHKGQGGDFVDVDIVVDKLQPLCTEDSIPVTVRLSLLQLVEQLICTEDNSESEGISSCKSRLIIQSCWPDLKVENEEVESNEGRERLFHKILSSCKTVSHFTTLSDLILKWPPLPSSSNRYFKDNCWSTLMIAILKVPDLAMTKLVINIMRQIRGTLDIECLQPVMVKLSQNTDVLEQLRFSLLTDHRALHIAALQNAAYPSLENCIELEKEISSLLVHHRLVPQTVTTSLYPPLMKYMCAELTSDKVKQIANDLKESGYFLEAAALLTLSLGIPESLQNFATATGLLQRLMP